MIDTRISLLVAAMDLRVVQLLRDAIRTADTSGHAPGGLPFTSTPAARFEPRPVVHPTPRFAPRPVIHPTLQFAPRPVVHPAPQYQTNDVGPGTPEKPPRLHLPFEPVWKQLPPVRHPAQSSAKIKVVRRPPDIVHKGSLLDLFI